MTFLTTPTTAGMVLGNNPFFIKMFAELAKKTGEDLSPGGTPKGGNSNEEDGLVGFFRK
jgi:hypothetical protein